MFIFSFFAFFAFFFACGSFFELVSKDMSIVKSVLLLTGSIEGLKSKVVDYIGTFSKYGFLWKSDLHEEYSKFMKKNPNLEDFELELKKYMVLEKEIGLIPPVHNIGALSLETQPMKYSLKSEATSWKSQFASKEPFHNSNTHNHHDLNVHPHLTPHPLQQKWLQQITGKFLHPTRSADETTVHALNDPATKINTGTQTTNAALNNFLDCCTTHQTPTKIHGASNMILSIHLDAAHLVAPEARS